MKNFLQAENQLRSSHFVNMITSKYFFIISTKLLAILKRVFRLLFIQISLLEQPIPPLLLLLLLCRKKNWKAISWERKELPEIRRCQNGRIFQGFAIFKKLEILDFWPYLGNEKSYRRSAGVKTTEFLGLFSQLRGSHSLSAQRARRTKSRGPKGLQLEVGARRAPKLLVFSYFWPPPQTHLFIT